eukprot:8381590-Pyramimonas_sp.AAC.1
MYFRTWLAPFCFCRWWCIPCSSVCNCARQQLIALRTGVARVLVVICIGWTENCTPSARRGPAGTWAPW